MLATRVAAQEKQCDELQRNNAALWKWVTALETKIAAQEEQLNTLSAKIATWQEEHFPHLQMEFTTREKETQYMEDKSR